jgi:hypothetical protein
VQVELRRQRESNGMRRYRPGPGRLPAARGPSVAARAPGHAYDKEILAIEEALDEHGPTERRGRAWMA